VVGRAGLGASDRVGGSRRYEHCSVHCALLKTMLQFGVASPTTKVKGGLRHLQLLLLASLVAAEARVLTEASVHPAQALQVANNELQAGSTHQSGDATVATSHFCKEVSNTFTSTATQISGVRPSREVHHGTCPPMAPATSGTCSTGTLAAAGGMVLALAVKCYSYHKALARQERISAALRAALQVGVDTRRRWDAAVEIQFGWRQHHCERVLRALRVIEMGIHCYLVRQSFLETRQAAIYIQSFARLLQVAKSLEDESYQHMEGTVAEAYEENLAVARTVCYSHSNYIGCLPLVREGLAWLRGQACVLQAAARGLLARAMLAPYLALIRAAHPCGARPVVRLRVIFGKLNDLLVIDRASGRCGTLRAILEARLGFAAPVQPPRSAKKKAANAKKNRDRKAAQAALDTPVGSLVAIEQVFYCVRGRLQLPLRLLRKLWTSGPSGSRSLGEEARLVLRQLKVQEGPAGPGGAGSDSEEENDPARPHPMGYYVNALRQLADGAHREQHTSAARDPAGAQA
jgi:hypothetical protein